MNNEFRMQIDGQDISAYQDLLSRYPEGRFEIMLVEESTIDIYKMEIRELDARGRPLVAEKNF